MAFKSNLVHIIWSIERPIAGVKLWLSPQPLKNRLNSSAGYYTLCDEKKCRTMTDKMVVRKYDPVARKHVEYKGRLSN